MTLSYKSPRDNCFKRSFGYKQVFKYSIQLSREEEKLMSGDKEYKFGFKVFSENKIFLFICRTVQDFKTWIEAFKRFFDKKSSIISNLKSQLMKKNQVNNKIYIEEWKYIEKQESKFSNSFSFKRKNFFIQTKFNKWTNMSQYFNVKVRKRTHSEDKIYDRERKILMKNNFNTKIKELGISKYLNKTLNDKILFTKMDVTKLRLRNQTQKFQEFISNLIVKNYYRIKERMLSYYATKLRSLYKLFKEHKFIEAFQKEKKEMKEEWVFYLADKSLTYQSSSAQLRQEISSVKTRSKSLIPQNAQNEKDNSKPEEEKGFILELNQVDYNKPSKAKKNISGIPIGKPKDNFNFFPVSDPKRIETGKDRDSNKNIIQFFTQESNNKNASTIKNTSSKVVIVQDELVDFDPVPKNNNHTNTINLFNNNNPYKSNNYNPAFANYNPPVNTKAKIQNVIIEKPSRVNDNNFNLHSVDNQLDILPQSQVNEYQLDLPPQSGVESHSMQPILNAIEFSMLMDNSNIVYEDEPMAISPMRKNNNELVLQKPQMTASSYSNVKNSKGMRIDTQDEFNMSALSNINNTEFNETVDIQLNMTQIADLPMSSQPIPKPKKVRHTRTLLGVSSPHFGNISIIAQRYNKIDHVDDWKNYINK